MDAHITDQMHMPTAVLFLKWLSAAAQLRRPAAQRSPRLWDLQSSCSDLVLIWADCNGATKGKHSVYGCWDALPCCHTVYPHLVVYCTCCSCIDHNILLKPGGQDEGGKHQEKYNCHIIMFTWSFLFKSVRSQVLQSFFLFLSGWGCLKYDSNLRLSVILSSTSGELFFT